MSAPRSRADVQASDLAAGAAVTALVFVVSTVALAHARLEHRAALPAVDPGIGIPIEVRPVLDLPAGGSELGGRSGAPSVPRAWRRKVSWPADPPADPGPLAEPEAEPEPAPSDLGVAVTKPKKRSRSKARARARGEAASEPSPSADDEASQTEEATESEGEGAGEGEAASEGEGGGTGASAGPGSGEGGGEGTDPLLERAIAFYRARLVAWFSARFRVSGSGLSPAELAKHRVRVQIELGEDLSIGDSRILSSDHPAFEMAARSMLDKLRGEILPPPPENYPGAVQRRLTVTFTCAEDTCD